MPDSLATIDPMTVTGWGVDADPANDPTYPYRDRDKDSEASRHWQSPSAQPESVEVLQSIEHDRRPAVFGTSSPPKWVSGAIRRQAFKYSESNLAHWLLLMGADRINMVEGLVEDFARGKLPNIPAEMGLRAEWAHNRKGLATKAGIAAGLVGALFLLRRASRRERSSD